MRTLLIAGNWKMNPASRAEAIALAGAVKPGVGQATEVRVVLCPPSVFLADVDAVLDGSPIGLGAQNMHWAAAGADTGEISGAMLVDAGCTHVILGHSERRQAGETDAQVNAKLHAALAARLIPDRLHWRDQGTAAERPDRARAALATRRLAGWCFSRTDGRHRAGLRASLGDWHRLDRYAATGSIRPCIYSELACSRVGRGDGGASRRPVRRECQAGLRRRTAGLPRHRRSLGRRRQSQGNRLPGDLPCGSGRHPAQTSMTR